MSREFTDASRKSPTTRVGTDVEAQGFEADAALRRTVDSRNTTNCRFAEKPQRLLSEQNVKKDKHATQTSSVGEVAHLLRLLFLFVCCFSFRGKKRTEGFTNG